MNHFIGQSVFYHPTNDKKLDKNVREFHNKYAAKELVIIKLDNSKADVFVRSTGIKLYQLNLKALKQY